MIDLDKLIQWALVAFSVASIVLVTHLLTVQVMFQEFKVMNAEVHETTVVEQGVSEFPLPRLNSPDSLAYCIAMVGHMTRDH
tara:strand:- start:578 stop:823 length:246 start_codon:yes stop_codon:yes gene_type:complete